MSTTEEKERQSGDIPRASEAAEPMLPTTQQDIDSAPKAVRSGLHPAVYIAAWISISSTIIIFNKWILSTKGFHFPIFLTTWHLAFATLMTQLMARFTTMLDSRKTVPITGRVYLRTIVPIGAAFSLSLICGNLTYLYLSVSFIQMLKATTPVAVLLMTWAFQVTPPNVKTLGNVSIIVVGVIIASVGEIKFDLLGVIYQVGGIIFEAIRLVMVQRLLSSAEFKMDPLVSLYYFAPACAVMNGFIALIVEVPRMGLSHFQQVGFFTLLANAFIAFLLNVSSVFLIGKTSSLVLTLSGVLKDILLVFASMLIFGDPVSLTQFFGYAVALAGLVYYKLGADQLRAYFGETGSSFTEYGQKHPIMRILLFIGLAACGVFILMGGLSPMLPVEYQETAKAKIDATLEMAEGWVPHRGN